MIGDYKLHPNVRIVAASNRITDQAAVNKMISPLKTRFTHIDLQLNLNEFKEYVEEQVLLDKWSEYILGFINFKPEDINNFDPNTVDDVTTFACPRSWEMLSKQIKAGLLSLPSDVYQNVITGIIGESAGNSFNSYLEIFKDLPTVADIEKDPSNCHLPSEISAQWALSTLLLQGINPNNTKQMAEYIERITNDDIKVVIYRTLLRKCPSIVQEPLVQKAMGILKLKLNAIKTP